jgi:hypothetical protein
MLPLASVAGLVICSGGLTLMPNGPVEDTPAASVTWIVNV